MPANRVGFGIRARFGDPAQCWLIATVDGQPAAHEAAIEHTLVKTDELIVRLLQRLDGRLARSCPASWAKISGGRPFRSLCSHRRDPCGVLSSKTETDALIETMRREDVF